VEYEAAMEWGRSRKSPTWCRSPPVAVGRVRARARAERGLDLGPLDYPAWQRGWRGCGGPHALPSTSARTPTSRLACTCRPDIGTRSQRPPGEETGILCGVPRATRGPCIAPALARTQMHAGIRASPVIVTSNKTRFRCAPWRTVP
jgi:hypothetical protein